ncbi:MAG: hypothetical protein DDT19_00699 [Syntrophomonadaceae bacterium]|nr:hypothetical protein [Bacillota bacterium]
MTTDFLEIHTSDRSLFKRCRRKWGFASPLKMHLEPDPPSDILSLWFGTGIHFALEDHHGFRKFASPSEALEAYLNAFRQEDLPFGAEDLIEVGMGMLEYYEVWSTQPGRPQYETLWIEGKPQLEVEFRLELEQLSNKLGRPVVYHGTFDRICTDEEGGLWVDDYKTTRTMDIYRLATDPQMKAYAWAAEQVYGAPFEGALMLQMLKKYPQKPSALVKGGFSQNKTQKTTHAVYKSALIETYGKVPPSYVEFLNYLASQEFPEGDAFIRRDKIYYNDAVKRNTYQHILDEGAEMLTPDLPLYPNETYTCSWDCGAFRTVCIAMEEKGDYEDLLATNFKRRGDKDTSWRNRIKWPQE